MKGNPKLWHLGHTQKLIPLDSGPHKGKWVCVECKNRWVRWATKQEVENESRTRSIKSDHKS
jgi:hypothetical protein